jgi:MFS family permease
VKKIESPFTVLVVLALINFLNYVDRSVLAGLVPHLKDPHTGLGLDDGQIGILQSAFMVVHSVASIPLGILAERMLRTRLIAIGVGVWSIATALAGFAQSFWQMFVARASVGIGEAAYAPAASALISEKFSDKARGRAMGVFQAGMVFGGGVGLVAGAAVASAWGWRAAFFLVGLPGFLLVVVALAIAETPRKVHTDAKKPATAELRMVIGTPAVFWVYLSGVLITFMVGAFQHWGLEFVIRYHYGGDADRSGEVAAAFGPLLLAAAVSGVVVGSILGDRSERLRPGQGRMGIVGLGPLLGAPFVLIGVWSDSLTLLYIALPLGTFLNSFYGGPVLAALHDMVDPHVRAAATGAYFFAVHLLGDAISPGIVGYISKGTADISFIGANSLRVGLSVAAVAAILGGMAALSNVRRSGRHHAARSSLNIPVQKD